MRKLVKWLFGESAVASPQPAEQATDPAESVDETCTRPISEPAGPSDPRVVAGKSGEWSQDAAPDLKRAADAVAGDWNPGDVILDLYEVQPICEGSDRVYASGGMGKVYRVHHRGWDMDLAAKIPHAELFADLGHQQSFVRECETWVNLGLHPHTVSCSYVRLVENVPVVFAEFVEGGNLREWIIGGRLYDAGPDESLARILDVAIQTAWGLHYAHDQGLIHQDVKPANVMMTADGTAKITDFGLARARAAAGETAPVGQQASILVSFGGLTPAYCSPEQASQEKLSRRTDLWSWAVSVLEMFTGELTWPSGSRAGDALEAYLQRGPRDKRIPAMPPTVADLLRQCFQRDSAARPKDMQVVAARLQEAYGEVVGRPYERQEPKPAELLADGLNNRALSLLDLGKPDDAEQAWREALEHDAAHLAATYNLGLLQWRRGQIPDDEVVRRLEEVRKGQPTARTAYLLAMIHEERADLEAAVAELNQAASDSAEDVDIRAARQRLEPLKEQGGRCLRTFEGHTDEVNSVCLSADGRFALSGDLDKTLRLWNIGLDGPVQAPLEISRVVTAHAALESEAQFAASLDTARKGLRDGDLNGALVSLQQARGMDGRERDRQALDLWHTLAQRCVRVGLRNGWHLRTFEGHTDDVLSVCLSADDHFALSGGWDRTLCLFELDWEYEFPGWANWHEGAAPHLANFLNLHTPCAGALPETGTPSEAQIQATLTRRGKPAWSNDDFNQLLHTLACAGYGWLRPGGVKRKLEKMAANWQGPPELFP